MKTSRVIFCMFLVLLSFSLFGQTKISGKIISADEKPLIHATVLLLNPKDSTLIKGVLTDDAGIFNFESAAAGNYIISATYTGYKQVYSKAFNITRDKPKLEIETIKLSGTKELSTVTVTAKKPLYEMKIDRLVINVASAITYTGISALDVLERSPGVIVNRINNSLTINGKDGVIIMINGKRNYMDISALIEMLAGMPSGNIEKIEIITTPPANFDAEGNAGIINIVLKSNDHYGTNGSYTLTTGYNTGMQNSVSANINHRKGKINLYGNYSLWDAHLIQKWYNYHAVNNVKGFNENYSDDDRHGAQVQHNIQLGMDYQASKQTIIGILFSGNYRTWTMTSYNNASVINNRKLDTSLSIINKELHTTLYLGANLNFQHTFKHEEKITFNADYLHYEDKNPNTYLNSYNDGDGNFLLSENVRSNKNTPLRFLIFAADFSKKVSKKTDMEAGLKFTNSYIKNDISVDNYLQNNWISDSSLSGNHTQKENIVAGYTSFNIKFSEKNSIKMGLRYEYTTTHLSSPEQINLVDRKYGNLFPSFYFLHTFDKNNSIHFSYSRRIYRPGFYDLAPWVIFLDPKTFQTGNPYLKPSFTDAVSVSYTLKNYIVSITYSYITPTLSQLPKLDTVSNKLITASQNSKDAQSVSLQLMLPFTITKWWNAQNNISFNWQQNNIFYTTIIKAQSSNIFLNSTQNFILPKDFSISTSVYYSSKYKWGLYTFNPWCWFDAGLQKKFSKKRSTLSVNVTNILNSVSISKANFPSVNLLMRTKNIYGRTGVSLSFTHNFGNDKVKQKRDRSTGDEDEKGRAY